MSIELDYMEYATDGAAQAAYVTNSSGDLQCYSESSIKTQGSYSLKSIANATSEVVDQQQDTYDAYRQLGNVDGNNDFRPCQSFQLSDNLTISKVDLYFGASTGSPSGNVIIKIETDSGGFPSGILADVNATSDGISPTASDWNTFTFSVPFSLASSTTFWIRPYCDSQSNNNYWTIGLNTAGGYADGHHSYYAAGEWNERLTQDEAFKVYVSSTSLNKTLIRTIGSPIDLTDQTQIKFDVYSSRTGSNFKVGMHDSGGTTSEKTFSISSANVWETITWDISAITNSDKDAIDQIIVTMTNADAANTFYIDNMYASVGETSAFIPMILFIT